MRLTSGIAILGLLCCSMSAPGARGGQPLRLVRRQVAARSEPVFRLAGVQREVPPRVTVPAQRVGGGVGRDDRLMGLGRVDQEVGVLLRVEQEVGEGLVVYAKRAIGGRAWARSCWRRSCGPIGVLQASVLVARERPIGWTAAGSVSRIPESRPKPKPRGRNTIV